MAREYLPDFGLDNPLYAGATVAVHTVDANGAKTSTLATLFEDATSDKRLGNPQRLGSRGRWARPVYVGEPVIIAITGLQNVDDHDTGIGALNLLSSAVSDAEAARDLALGYLGQTEELVSRVLSTVSGSLVPVMGTSQDFLRGDGTGTLERRTPRQVRTDLGLDRIYSDAGGDDGYEISADPAITGYAAGQWFFVTAATPNTGPCTLNVNGIGAVAIKLPNGDDPGDGDVIAGLNLLVHDGTNFVVFPGTPQLSHGQVRFEPVSETQCRLRARGSGGVLVDGVMRRVSADITIGTGGLAADTLYYAYLYDNGGALDLEFSPTGHATQSNGVETLNGDGKRTLVGMVQTNSSTQFVDTETTRHVRTWFSDRGVTARDGGLSVGVAVGAPTLWTAGPTVDVLTWSGEELNTHLVFSGLANTINNTITYLTAVNGAPVSEVFTPAGQVGITNTHSAPHSAEHGEGRQVCRILAGINAGTYSISNASMSVWTTGIGT